MFEHGAPTHLDPGKQRAIRQLRGAMRCQPRCGTRARLPSPRHGHRGPRSV